MNAHKTASSPTHRGRFVRLHLLCEDVPPPPPGIDTTLPDDPGEAGTLRERLAVHTQDPACRPCHLKMDPIGFGLEHYDALGAWRETDQGRPIDAVTDLDGEPFEGGVELGELLASQARVGACIVRRFYRHATAHLEERGEKAYVDALAQRFAADGFDFKQRVVETVVSGGFRLVRVEAQP